MTVGPFKDDYRWLSNFWLAPITYNGVIYPTTEHFYQSHKTIIPAEIQQVIDSPTPGVAKRAGLTITPRDDWDNIKFSIMRKATILKYSQHEDLMEMLLGTGNEDLVEYNHWHDNFWGFCTCAGCQDLPHLNNLGQALEDVRSFLSKC